MSSKSEDASLYRRQHFGENFGLVRMRVKSNYRINTRQLRRLTLLETGTIGCLFVTMWSGKENGLLTVMLSIIGSLIYAGILIAIGRTDGGFYAMTERVLPGPLYRMVWLIYVVRFAVRGAWMISYLEYLIQISTTLFHFYHLLQISFQESYSSVFSSSSLMNRLGILVSTTFLNLSTVSCSSEV